MTQDEIRMFGIPTFLFFFITELTPSPTAWRHHTEIQKNKRIKRPKKSPGSKEKNMNIVLINPEIPFNTGNIGRTCVATNTPLHLVGKLGFKIEEKEIRRSGLDYWAKLKYTLYPDFEDFLTKIPKEARLFFFSTKGEKNLWDIRFEKDDYLLFGSESCGLPKHLYTEYKDHLYKIPMPGEIRSLNLSTSAAICLYEALRQTR